MSSGTSFVFPAALVLAGLLLAGCRGEPTMVSQKPGSPAISTSTARAGRYALYTLKNPIPRVTVYLQENEEIGFRQRPDGELVGVAGAQEFPLLPHETYYWKRL